MLCVQSLPDSAVSTSSRNERAVPVSLKARVPVCALHATSLQCSDAGYHGQERPQKESSCESQSSNACSPDAENLSF